MHLERTPLQQNRIQTGLLGIHMNERGPLFERRRACDS